MKIAFLENFLAIRGTTIALYDYAYFNKHLLKNTSIIITRPYEINHDTNPDACQEVHDKFKKEFPIHYYLTHADIQSIIHSQDIDVLYIIKSGDMYDGLHSFQNVKTLIHCVFETRQPHGDFYCCISPWVNIMRNTTLPILPHIVYLPDIQEHLRMDLDIPTDAVVFGRYGGIREFNIEECHNVVRRISQEYPNIYFLFMNTPQFCPPQKNVIYLDRTTDMIFKTKFINTCDAMIHGGCEGETFGLAIGEFSIRNKPIFAAKNTSNGDHMYRMHQIILKDNAYWFENEEDLYQKMISFDPKEAQLKDWNMYREYSPENVMNFFNQIIHSF